MFTESDPLVISSTALIAFGRCPKSYELGYVDRYRMAGKECMRKGSEFHYLMQRLYQGATEEELEQIGRDGEFPEMWDVFTAYRLRRGHTFPDVSRVLHTEEPLYTRLLPNVWLRTTFDRIWNDDGEITDDDYKTFDKAPSLDVSLDTQGRLFLCVLRKHFTDFTRFKRRYLNVRRMPPGVPKNATQLKAQAAGKPFESWREDECYVDRTLRLIDGEAEVIWKEAQSRAEKILWSHERRTKDPSSQPFDRVYLKGSSPYTCSGMICRSLCAKQMAQGGLTDIDLIMEGVTVQEELKLPEGLLK